MTTLEPGAALTTCETALRNLMTVAYSSDYGPDWLHRVAGEKLEQWHARAESEFQARGPKGVIAVPDAGLSYANFFDLLSIADKHWEPLAPALGKKAAAVALLKRLDNLRNTVGHSRPLLPFERDLMSGIAGQIRNQVTIYMSSRDDVGDIYPRIEAISDSFGRRIESATAETELAGSATTPPYVLVRPGDEVTFDCTGIDPQGRDLEWTLGSAHLPLYPVTTSASGVLTQLTWTVNDSDVNESKAIEIYLRADGTPYHRWGYFDHRAYFMFRVRPPA